MSYTDPCYGGLDALDDKRIVFLCDRIAAIQGSAIEQQLSLKSFFVPVTDSVFSSFILPADSGSVTVSYANITSPSLLFILADYDSSLTDAEMYISWSFDETVWYPLGKIFSISGTSDSPLGQVYIKNDLETDVTVRTIIGA